MSDKIAPHQNRRLAMMAAGGVLIAFSTCIGFAMAQDVDSGSAGEATQSVKEKELGAVLEWAKMGFAMAQDVDSGSAGEATQSVREMELTAVAEWAKESLIKATSFSFTSYERDLEEAKANFTADGWKSFRKALDDSGNLATVIDEKLVLKSEPRGELVLKVKEARRFWGDQLVLEATMPITMSFFSQNDERSQKGVATATIVANPDSEERPLGISQVLVK